MNKIMEKLWDLLLKGQEPKKSDKIVYLYGSTLLIISFIIFFVVSNLYTKSRIKLDDFNNKLSEIEELKSKEPEIRLKYANLPREIVRLKDKFVLEGEVEQLKIAFTKYAQMYGGNNISTMPQSQTREGLLTKIPVRIGMEINLPSFIKFLHLLEHSNKFVDVSHISINTMDGGKKLRTDAVLNLYLLTPDVDSRIDNISETKVTKQMSSLAMVDNISVPRASRNVFLSPTPVTRELEFNWPVVRFMGVVSNSAILIIDGKRYQPNAGDFIDEKKFPDIRVFKIESRFITLVNKKGEQKSFEIAK